jgi:tetratricopeptide (TPR) repeat protein
MRLPDVATFVFCLTLFGYTPASSAQYSLPPPPPTPQSDCPGGCQQYYPAPNVPAGPTPAELKAAREAKDSKEAADDADDKGTDFYNKGDWADAVKSFQEALDYNPDDDVAQGNLKHAQDKLDQQQAALRSAAAQQAVNAQTRSTTAAVLSNEPSSMEARKPFDDADNTKNSGIAVPVGSDDAGHKDPAVPTSERTPAITKLEQQRAADRRQRVAMEAKRKTLDPQKDAVAISAIKQQESNIDNKINYINFSISDALRAPATVPKASTK